MRSFLSRPPKPGFVAVAAAVVAFIVAGTRTTYGVFVVPLEEVFGLTRAQVTLPFSLSMFIVGMGSPFTGAFMDAKGPRKVILVAVMLSALGIAVTAAAQNLWQLTVGYGLLSGRCWHWLVHDRLVTSGGRLVSARTTWKSPRFCRGWYASVDFGFWPTGGGADCPIGLAEYLPGLCWHNPAGRSTSGLGFLTGTTLRR